MICTFQVQYEGDNHVRLVPYLFERTEYTTFGEDNSHISKDEHSVNHNLLQVKFKIYLT